MMKFACEDLEAVRVVVQVVEAGKDWTAERKMLAVTIRALTPIIDDIREALDNIGKTLKKTEQDVQQNRSELSEIE